MSLKLLGSNILRMNKICSPLAPKCWPCMSQDAQARRITLFGPSARDPGCSHWTNISVGCKNNQYNQYWFSSCRSFVPSFQGRLWSPHRRFGYQTQWKYNAGGQWRQDTDVWAFRIPWDYVLKKTTKIPNPIFTYFYEIPFKYLQYLQTETWCWVCAGDL